MAFEWNPRDGGTCYLKDSAGAVPRVWEGAQIGVLVTPGSLISPQAIASNNAAAAGAMSSEAQREQAPPAPELPDALCPSQT